MLIQFKVNNPKPKHILFYQFIISFHFRCDSLTIFDGDSENSPMVGKYCGSEIPSSFMSSSNDIFIVFKSDDLTNGPGYKLEYKSFKK